ncbi:MAG: hypothetical protein AABX00_03235 [Nanoarchaeota archaeon]
MKNKKASGIPFILIAIIIFFAAWWFVSISNRECNSNKECSSESYCGSDFACHPYPNIQKTVVQYSLFWPSIIMAVALIVVTLILRWERIMPKKEEVIVHHVEHKEEPIEHKEKEYYQRQAPKNP